MPTIIDGTTGISPVTASGTSASVDGMTVGRGGGEVATNTAVGASALAATATGTENTGIGSSALTALTTGSYNTAVGRIAMQSNTTGEKNTAVGRQSLFSNVSGTDNSALGYIALLYTTGSYNSGVGSNALSANTTGTQNTAMGYATLKACTTAQNNAAFGDQALQASTTASYNTALGSLACFNTTTGAQNVAVGYSALNANTTASNNTVVGYQAGYTNSTGLYNTFVGAQAGYSSTGGENTCVGRTAGYSISTGTGNTFIGPGNGATSNGAGYYVTTGSDNTIIGGYNGNQNGLDIRTASNAIILSDGDGYPKGYFATNTYGEFTLNSSLNATYNGILNFADQTTAKSQIYYQRNVTSLYVVNSSAGVYLGAGSTAWASASDERLKDIIEPITNGLTKVASLRAVIGKFKTDAEGTRRSFLIAQDVQAVLPEAISTTMVKDDETNTEYLGVSYTDVIPLLVAAIKELKAEFDAYKATHP